MADAARDPTLVDFPLAADFPELLKSTPALFIDTIVFNVKRATLCGRSADRGVSR